MSKELRRLKKQYNGSLEIRKPLRERKCSIDLLCNRIKMPKGQSFERLLKFSC